MPDTVNRDLLAGEPTEPYTPMFTGALPAAAQAADAPSEPLPAPAHPLVVPGSHPFLKRWTFVGVVACVWIAAAAAGWGLYYWWFQSIDKTASLFVVLVFLVVCGVGGLLTAMVPDRPAVAALAIALMSAPLAATAGAAVLHGLNFCEYASRCLIGLIPY